MGTKHNLVKNMVKTTKVTSPLLSARADQVPTVEVAQGIAADVCAVWSVASTSVPGESGRSGNPKKNGAKTPGSSRISRVRMMFWTRTTANCRRFSACHGVQWPSNGWYMVTIGDIVFPCSDIFWSPNHITHINHKSVDQAFQAWHRHGITTDSIRFNRIHHKGVSENVVYPKKPNGYIMIIIPFLNMASYHWGD